VPTLGVGEWRMAGGAGGAPARDHLGNAREEGRATGADAGSGEVEDGRRRRGGAPPQDHLR
jgi:hypothetical protein